MKKLLQQALDLVFPAVRCLACDEPRQIDAGAPLCDRCQLALDQLRVPDSACGHCLSPMQSGRPCSYCAAGGMAHIDQAFAPFVYRDVSAALIKRLKYGVVALAALPLAREMALCISGIRFDALVPVPLYPSSQRARGMNQSRLLCDLISGETGLPVLDALKKIRKTRPQSSLSPEKRGANVKGAMALAQQVSGLDILLVDDVRTTGNTVRECARVLMEGGAATVCLLTAAVANPRTGKNMWRLWNSFQEPSA